MLDQVLTDEVGSLVGFLDAHDVPLDHFKPHRALFGMVAADEELMLAICDVAVQHSVSVFRLAGTAHESACAAAGVEFVPALYVDLDYRDDDMIVLGRSKPFDAASRTPSSGDTSSPLPVPRSPFARARSASTPTC